MPAAVLAHLQVMSIDLQSLYCFPDILQRILNTGLLIFKTKVTVVPLTMGVSSNKYISKESEKGNGTKSLSLFFYKVINQ